ncbi:nuclear transport factor 2 family protein [Mycobacterium sp. WUMAC-067]|uniref:nuclear transport factor 2 family protein n=1 Tax=unclassified Mycobacterium TaxID=2642494 RepID=UPI001CD9920C|nr:MULTISPECIES: nuclear transport factor 2 family protein [unclassified Mycobacterium]MCA2240930.1 nuclear transport factor 2 family protein [Mycobacterium sp. WUMAC-067]MCA2313098.1 nuclear transport factor 2 family protein [Mycobacterium sp. WUMAC-025]
MPASRAEAVVEAANRLFTAIERSDVAAVEAMWSDDIAVWRVGSRRDPLQTDDKARAMRVIGWFIGATTQRRYEILDRQFFDDGSAQGFVQQHVLHATGHAGQSISLRVCIVIRVGSHGLIERIDEYFDPAGIAPLMD